MKKNDQLRGKIEVQNKKIQVQTEPKVKERLRKELEILLLQQQIEELKNRIELKRKNL